MRDYEDSELLLNYEFRSEFIRLEFFDIYLFNMKRLFEEAHAKIIETYGPILADKEKALERMGTEDDEDCLTYSEIQMHYEIEELTMNNISVDLFYPSFFISLYADFEKSLIKLCDEVRSPNKQSIHDFRKDKGIQRAKKYLVKVLNINEDFFGKNRDWEKICNYGELRNNLVHNDEVIFYTDTKNELIQFFKRDDPKLLSLTRSEIKRRGIKWFSLNKEFCSDAINVIGDFWVSLFFELSKDFKI